MLLEYSWFNPWRRSNNKALFRECVVLGMDRLCEAMYQPYDDYVWLYRPYDWAKMPAWVEFLDKDKYNASRVDVVKSREAGEVVLVNRP